MKETRCDYCGKTMQECQGEILVRFSYGSKYAMHHVELDICDDCFEHEFPGIIKRVGI